MEEVKKTNVIIRDSKEVTEITFDIFQSYLSDIEKEFGEIKCSECGSHLWNILRSPNNQNSPNVVTLPMPLSPGMGIWAFHISCNNCGSMRFFEASHVVEKINKKDGK